MRRLCPVQVLQWGTEIQWRITENTQRATFITITKWIEIHIFHQQKETRKPVPELQPGETLQGGRVDRISLIDVYRTFINSYFSNYFNSNFYKAYRPPWIGTLTILHLILGLRITSPSNFLFGYQIFFIKIGIVRG